MGSVSHIFVWYWALTKDTKTLVCVAGFEPIMCLLLESSTNGILVQVLADRWLDTTHTFHIARMDLTVTPHDFHWMTDLRADGSIINLEVELSVQLGADLLGHRYSSEHIHYFDLERDYKPLSQVGL